MGLNRSYYESSISKGEYFISDPDDFIGFKTGVAYDYCLTGFGVYLSGGLF